MLERSAEHHQITGDNHKHGKWQIQAAGIYPSAFIGKGRCVEVLANPLRLIRAEQVDIGAKEKYT